MPDFKTHLQYLNTLGVEFHLESEYRGEPGNGRERFDLDLISSVKPPIGPKEWVALCQNEGPLYVGGCCGNMSAVQDEMDYIFRFESGWFPMHRLERIADTMTHHDDECFGRLEDGEDLETAVKNMAESIGKINQSDDFCIDVWKLLGLVWEVARPFYSPKRPHSPSRRTNPVRTELDDAVTVVRDGIQALAIHDLFSRNDEETAQGRTNRLMVLYRVLPALKTVWENVSELDPGNLDGLALVKKDDRDTVLVNGYGLCVYQTPAEAQKVLDLWTREEEEYEEREPKPKVEDFELRSVRVSMQKGLEFIDG